MLTFVVVLTLAEPLKTRPAVRATALPATAG
jgi:hypothetical protein